MEFVQLFLICAVSISTLGSLEMACSSVIVCDSAAQQQMLHMMISIPVTQPDLVRLAILFISCDATFRH
jgi:hypothetical protein